MGTYIHPGHHKSAADVVTDIVTLPADVSAASGTVDVRAAQHSVGLRVVAPVLAGLVSLAMIVSAGYLCVRRRELPSRVEGRGDVFCRD